jgi:hypothetical protein
MATSLRFPPDDLRRAADPANVDVLMTANIGRMPGLAE